MKSFLQAWRHHRPHVGDGGVVVVADELASVDAALRVAPGDHVLHRVAHLLVEAGKAGEAPVVAVGEVDRGVGDALVGGSAGVPLAARRRKRAELGGRMAEDAPVTDGALSLPRRRQRREQQCQRRPPHTVILFMTHPPVRAEPVLYATRPGSRTGSRLSCRLATWRAQTLQPPR